MTDAELDFLESLARTATPGPWRHPGRALVVSRMDSSEPLVCDCISKQFAQAPKDAAYIAAANPAAILELIAELRQTRKERDWLAEQIGGNLPCPPYSIVIDETNCDNECCEDCWLKAAREAVSNNPQPHPQYIYEL